MRTRLTDPEELVSRLDAESMGEGLTLEQYRDRLRELSAALESRAAEVEAEVEAESPESWHVVEVDDEVQS